jgi:hypothetical protein
MPTDFNDLHKLEGIAQVAKQLNQHQAQQHQAQRQIQQTQNQVQRQIQNHHQINF